ncbi:hypothetical protein [Nocardioides campestrisoli]|uniref:hypothetical protein n=1 Tax=Nocardioides campestrisoli TaxID=2736757 RepID=UPI00163DB66A|nr:hypothetical protein [Nocardioides campestrisoli]
MTRRAYAPPATGRDRRPLLLLAAILGVLALLLPLAWTLDASIDHDRNLFTDRQQMAWIQHVNLANGGNPVAGNVGPDDEMKVGEVVFRPSKDISVEVRLQERTGAEGETLQGYCVRTSNEDGEEIPWLCHDLASPPSKPSGDPLADL